MSTPKNPGRKLPDRPATPPSLPQRSGPPRMPASAPASPSDGAEPPSDTRSVLERLKAAQPRAATPANDDGPRDRSVSGSSGGPSGGPSAGFAEAATPVAAKGQVTAKAPAEEARDRGANRAANQAADQAADQKDSGPGLAEHSKERLRLAARRAGDVAGTTGRAVGRGSSAAVQRLGSWNEDVVRQVVVTLCATACIVGSAAGVGAFGGPSIRDAAGGLFAPDATLLAPASSAFSIWGVIYAGLIAYTAFQWLPSQRRSARQRRLGWAVAASMFLNLAWILGAQADRLTLSLVIITLLLFTLLAAITTLNDHPAGTRLEGLFVDTPIGLYLGWVLVASAANAAAFLTATGVDLFELGGITWAVIGVVGVLMTAAIICSTDRGRLSVAVAVSWGLVWIGVERALGQPSSIEVAFATAFSVFVLLITAGSRRHRVDHAHRRWLRAQEDAQREPLDLLGDDYEDSRY